jgi:hypothetical protein
VFAGEAEVDERRQMRMPERSEAARSLDPGCLIVAVAGRHSSYEDEAAGCEVNVPRAGVERQKAIGEKCHNECAEQAMRIEVARRSPRVPEPPDR